MRNNNLFSKHIFLILALLSFCIVISCNYHSSKPVSYAGSCKQIQITIESPSWINEGTRKEGTTDLEIRMNAIVCTGTSIRFSDPTNNDNYIQLKPSNSDHVCYFDFKSLHSCYLTIKHGATLSLISGDSILENPAFDKALGDHPNYYNFAFLFLTDQNDPIWQLTLPEPKMIEKKPIFGDAYFAGYDTKLKNIPTFKTDKGERLPLVSGHFFSRLSWPIKFPPVFLDLIGYNVSIPPSGRTVEIDIKPKLHVCLPADEKSPTFSLSCSSLKTRGADGNLFISGSKKIEKGALADFEIESGNLQIELTPLGNAIQINVRGNADSLEISGKEFIKNILQEFSSSHPAMVSIFTALVASFIGALIATKGKIFTKWLNIRKT